jgi:Flp pilus assembly pilin Flp
MELLIKTFVKIRERKAQTMTEYALVMAAIAVAAYTAYSSLGKGIVNTITNVTGNL